MMMMMMTTLETGLREGEFLFFYKAMLMSIDGRDEKFREVMLWL